MSFQVIRAAVSHGEQEILDKQQTPFLRAEGRRKGEKGARVCLEGRLRVCTRQITVTEPQPRTYIALYTEIHQHENNKGNSVRVNCATISHMQNPPLHTIKKNYQSKDNTKTSIRKKLCMIFRLFFIRVKRQPNTHTENSEEKRSRRG